MPTQESNDKPTLNIMLQNITNSFIQNLEYLLDEESLANFKNQQRIVNDHAYYDSIENDTPLVKNSKLLINVLSCLSELADSSTSTLSKGLVIMPLANNLYNIGYDKLKLVYDNLYDHCNEIFILIQQGGLAGINAGNMQSMLDFLGGVYSSLNTATQEVEKTPAKESSSQQSNQFLVCVKQGFDKLKKLENLEVTANQPNNNGSNFLIKIHDVIVAAIEDAMSDQLPNFVVNEKGFYEITAADNAAIAGTKHVLNGVLSLSEAMNTWSSRKQNINVFATLADLYANLRLGSSGFK